MFWHKVSRQKIPISILWTAYLSLAVGFFASQIGHFIQQQYQESIKSLSEHHAAYGGSIAAHTTRTSKECVIEPFGFALPWGRMKSDAQFNREYSQISAREFIPPIAYNIENLTVPLESLHSAASTEDQKILTEKLHYSTRYMGEYDLDSAEFVTASHPAIDIKMPVGTPIRAISNGVVHALLKDDTGLGNTIILQSRVPGTLEKIFVVYGHMQDRIVEVGDKISVGQIIGTVGNTGQSTNPHLHLQIDRDRGLQQHTPYVPSVHDTKSTSARWTIHPIDFIENY